MRGGTVECGGDIGRWRAMSASAEPVTPGMGAADMNGSKGVSNAAVLNDALSLRPLDAGCPGSLVSPPPASRSERRVACGPARRKSSVRNSGGDGGVNHSAVDGVGD